jgi:hypothetical protein
VSRRRSCFPLRKGATDLQRINVATAAIRNDSSSWRIGPSGLFPFRTSIWNYEPYTVDRNPCKGDQLVERSLLHKTQTNIHALSWIRTHDPSFRAR